MSTQTENGHGLPARPCSAAFSVWSEKRGVWPRLTHEEIWNAAWKECIKHVQKNENIQIVGCPRCDHEFEAEIIFDNLELNVRRQVSLAGGVGGSQGNGVKALGMLFCQHPLCLNAESR